MRILIIGPSWVGDSVMAQTLYKCLKKEEPNCTIDVISPSWTLPIIQRMPEISESISSPFLHGDIKILSRYKFGKSFQKAGYERSITLANSLKSSLIPFFAKIPIRTGWLGEMRYGLLNDIRKLEPKRDYLMIEKFALLSSKETEISLENLNYPSLEINFDNQKEKLDLFQIDTNLPCLAICPGAEFGPSKKWPAEYYSEVAEVYIRNGWNVLCLGSLNDKETGNKIESFQGLDEENRFYNLIGETSLVDAVDLLAYCKRVVTNDSGLMHIAAAVGTPLVALYGPSSPEFTPPLTKRKKILRKIDGYEKIRKGDSEDGYHHSLLSIKPSEVIEALESL